jgi:PAS domain S-box-containing protein
MWGGVMMGSAWPLDSLEKLSIENVSDAIVRHPHQVVSNTTVVEAIAQMHTWQPTCKLEGDRPSQLPTIHDQARASCVLVMEPDPTAPAAPAQLVGIVTERDIVRICAQVGALQQTRVAEVMSCPVVTLREPEFTDIFQALNLLHQHRIRHVVLVDEADRPTGLVTHETLRCLARPTDLLRMRTVEEVMAVDVVQSSPDVPLGEVARLMAERRVSSVVLVEPPGEGAGEPPEEGAGEPPGENDADLSPVPRRPRPVGLISERDLVQFQALSLDLATVAARTVMSFLPFVVDRTETLLAVNHAMARWGVTRAVVVDAAGGLIGIVTQSSLLNLLNPLELSRMVGALEARVAELEQDNRQLLGQHSTALLDHLQSQIQDLRSQGNREPFLAALSARKTTELREHIQRDRIINEIAGKIRHSLNLQEILGITVHELRSVLQGDWAAVWQMPPTAAGGTWIAESLCDPTRSCRAAEPPWVLMLPPDWHNDLRRGQVRVIDDIQRLTAAPARVPLPDLRAQLLAPLIAENELWGVVVVGHWHQPRPWQPKEVALVQRLAMQVSIAVQQGIAYERIHQSELRLRGIFDGTLHLICLLDPYGTVLEVNRATLNLLQTSAREMVGRPLWLDPSWQRSPASLRQIQSAIAQAASGVTVTQTISFVGPNQQRMTLDFSVRPVQEQETGAVVFLIVEGHDMTQRHQAEVALRQSEARLRDAQHLAKVGNWDWDAEEQQLRWSPQLYHILEWDPDRVPPSLAAFWRRVHPSDRPVLRALLTTMQITGEPYQIEHRLLFPGGRIKHVAARGQGVQCTGDASQCRWWGTIQDVTRSRQSANALLQEKRFSDALIESLPGLFCLCDLQGRLRRWNHRYQEMLGYNLADLMDLTLLDLVVPEDRPALQAELQHLQIEPEQGGPEITLDVCFSSRYGESLPHQLVLRRLTLGGEVRLLGIAIDIRDRCRAEQDLQNLIEGTAGVTGATFFPELVCHIAAALDVPHVFAFQLETDGMETNGIDPDRPRMRSLAAWSQGQLQPATTTLVPLEQSPCCRQTLERGLYQTDDLSELAQQYPLLQRLRASSYLGIALANTAGQAIGVLCILGNRPLAPSPKLGHLLQAFAARAGAELERLQAQQALQDLNRDLETRIEQRTARLREREQQLRSLTNNVPGLVFRCRPDPARSMLFASAAVESLTGYTVKDFVHGPQSLHGCIHPADRSRVTKVIADALDLQIPYQIEYRLRHRDGSDRWVQERAQGTFDKHQTLQWIDGIITDISDLKYLEAELQQSAVHLHTAQRIARVGSWEYELATEEITWSDQVFEILGYDPAQDTPTYPQFLDQIQPGDRERHAALVERAIATGEPYEIEYGFTHPDGTTHYALARGEILGDHTGTITHLLGTIVDITQMRRTEVALRDSETILDALLEYAPTVIYVKDLNGRYLLVNKAFPTPTPADAIGHTDAELFSPEIAEQFRHNDQEVITLGQAQEYQEVLQDGNQTYTFLSLKFPLLDRDGQPYAVCGLSTDITERQAAEARLAELRDRLAVALQSAAIGCWDWDIPHDKLRWDERMYELYGVQPSNQNTLEAYVVWQQGLHPEDREAATTAVQDALAGVREFNCEFRVVHPDGSIHHIQANAITQRDAAGRPLRMIGVNMDITERKEAEAALQKTNAELEQATRLKSEFLANMSHELRTPLNAILGLSEGIQLDVYGELTDRQRQAIVTIERSGRHLLDLIEDILDLSKIEAGKLELAIAPVNLDALCQSSTVFVKNAALKKHITISTTIEPGLNSCEIDELRMRQLLINLLNNAVKFTPHGGAVNLSVFLDAEPHPNQGTVHPNPGHSWVAFAVRDTGIGIPPEEQNRLFQPFVQVNGQLNRTHGGTGLGLALVRRIAELHGGYVGLESQPGQGSCFTVWVPAQLSQGQPALQQDDFALDPIISPEDPHQGPLILVAEDRPDNVMAIAEFLRMRGCRLILAENGLEAFRQARKHHPDLILMDVQMPLVDGLEATERIRSDPALAHIPIVALTALAMASDRDRCLAAGANDYLSKPVRLRRLADVLEKWLPQPQNANSQGSEA